jgi:hypothetical protein
MLLSELAVHMPQHISTEFLLTAWERAKDTDDGTNQSLSLFLASFFLFRD